MSAAIDLILETNSHTGEDYFDRLVAGIATYFNVDGVYLSELALDFGRFETVAFHQDRTAPFSGDFSSCGICDEVVTRGSVVVSSGLGQVYGFDDRATEAFVGVVLRAASGDAIGALYVVNGRPLPEAALMETVLQTLAPRAGAELERRQRELALKRSESRLRLLTDRARDAFFFVQLLPDQQLQYVSPSVADLFEVPAEAFYTTPELFFRKLETDFGASFQEVFDSHEEESLVAKVQLTSGANRWVEYLHFAMRDDDGTVVGVGGTIRDVTRRVEAEEAIKKRDRYLQDLLLSIPDTLLLLGADGKVLDYVPGEVNTGLGEPDDVKGRHIKELMSPAIVGALERTIQATFRSRRLQRVQFEVPGPQARLHDVRCLPFGEGALLLVLRDLTACKGDHQWQRFRDDLDETAESQATSHPYGLTHREITVLNLIVEGMADKQIADVLGISTFTVNKHVGNVLGKMGALSRTEAGVRAIKEGLISSRVPATSIVSRRPVAQAVSLARRRAGGYRPSDGSERRILDLPHAVGH